jgi:hypothetical protein
MPLEVRTQWVFYALEIKEHHNALPHQAGRFFLIHFGLKFLYLFKEVFHGSQNFRASIYV